LLGGGGNDTSAFDPPAPGFNPSPVAAPDRVLDFDLAGDDVLDLGAPGTAANFLNSGQTTTTLASATTIADGLLGGSVIYVTVNVELGLGATATNTVLFWDSDGDGDADVAIALVNTSQALVQADDVV
jgi:hypothetical protein